MNGGALKLDEVAKAAGVSPRTVRYYLQRGLLPQPPFRGPDTAYGEEHVVRLRAIRRLQEAFWPLDAIAGLFASKTDDELRAIADGTTIPSARTPSAAATEPPLPLAGEGRGGGVDASHAFGAITHVRRIELADGVVLEVREPSTREAAALVERIRAVLPVPSHSRRTRNR